MHPRPFRFGAIIYSHKILINLWSLRPGFQKPKRSLVWPRSHGMMLSHYGAGYRAKLPMEQCIP